jgi:hypothetical protein
MDQQAAKQQIVDKIKQAENILVTVSANPTVDQLAACIGLTLILNKIEGKSATAVYSGKTPPVMEFLQPQKTLVANTDSLRDFIISLDKAKADKLRYKVEDQVVRIFITPYKTKLTDKDLTYSEGDFNVDIIVALGVADRTHLDTAITAHGRILHDAAVIAVTAGQGKAPDLGQINWQDPGASSLSEMLVSISDAFGAGLIDNQIATAFLTGIVAETERFSNKKTSPKVMTMSAQLMAAGANQQLVISKLQPPPPPPPPPPPKAPPPPPPRPEPGKEAKPANQKPAPNISLPPPQAKPKMPPPPPKKEQPPLAKQPQPLKSNATPSKPEVPLFDPGLLNVAHGASEVDGGEVEINTKEILIDKQGNLKMMNEQAASAPSKEPTAASNATSKPNEEADKKQSAVPPTPVPPPPIPKSTDVPPKLPHPPSVPPATFGTPLAQQAAPPPPPITSFNNSASLPVPPPTPAINKDSREMAKGPDSTATEDLKPVAANTSTEYNHHALLDPMSKGPTASAAFSADTLIGNTGSPNVSVDPVNAPAFNGQSEFGGHTKTINPPPPHKDPLEQLLAAQNITTPAAAPLNNDQNSSLTPDGARQAVENAYATVPFNPELNPAAGTSAQPAVPEMHTPPPQDPNMMPPAAPPPIPPPIPPPPPSL